MKNLLKLLFLYRSYALWMLLGVLASLITVLANIALMSLSGWFITSMALAGLAGTSINYFTPAAMIRAAAIVRTGGRYAERLVTHEATFRLLSELRVWFYRRIEPRVPRLLDVHRSGDLLSRISSDINNLDNFYVRLLNPLLVALLASPLLLYFVYLHSPQLAFLLAGGLLISGVLLPYLSALFAKIPGEAVVGEAADYRSSAIDYVQGLEELIVAGAEQNMRDTLNKKSSALCERQRLLTRIQAMAKAAFIACVGLTLSLGLWLLLESYLSSEITAAVMVMLLMLLLAAFEIVAPLAEAFRLLPEISVSAQRVFDLSGRAANDDKTACTREMLAPERLGGGPYFWKMQDVTYSYTPEGPTVLSEINLDLKPGKKVAVVGPTGSGKSSLIQLLSGLREPSSGELLINHRSFTEFDIESLRTQVSAATQNSHLFSASIRSNLCLGKPNASQEELDAVCELVQLNGWIGSLKDGYDTWLGETGQTVSQGQARRLSVARALLKPASLLLLDEPTEGLDAKTAKAMMTSILAHCQDASLLLVTHQLFGLESFDEIVVLENGRICERGNYAELIRAEGMFSSLYKHQVLSWPE